jgi:HSP90 family molecular chaperone
MEFIKAIGEGTGLSLIGQFFVVFFRHFWFADRVVVTSKHNDDD